MGMRLKDFLRPDLVVTDLRSDGVEDTIHALVERLDQQSGVEDRAVLEAALRSREAAHTTALGNGVAVPHAMLHGLTQPLVMVAVAPDGAVFGPVGLDPIRVFFVLLSPPDRAREHIKLLARIARLVRHPGFIERLGRAASARALLEEIERVDAEHV